MPWVTWIDIEDESSTNEEVRNLFRRTRNKITNKVTDTVRLTSLTPEVSELINNLSSAIQRNATGLTPREKEISALIVSVYNGCAH